MLLCYLFFIPVSIIDSYEGAGEGEYLAEGNEDTMMNLRQRRKDEARREHYAPEGAQCKSSD